MHEKYRHRKRGTIYTVIGTAELQVAEGTYLGDGALLVIYLGSDGKLWARGMDEFHDGRFELAPEAQPDQKETV